MRVCMLVLVVLVGTASADWWDSLTDSVSGGLTSAADWIKGTASPKIRDTFDDTKEALQDPETHKNFREWISDKAEKVSEFTQTEVLPELKKIYHAATVDSNEESSTIRSMIDV